MFQGAYGLRAVAAVSVVILHGIGLFFPDLSPYLSGTGQYGVWVFFILSAFLLTNKFLTRGFSVQEVVSYIVGRVIRIIPMFTFAVYAYYLLGFFDFDKMVSILKLQDTYAHLWTIPVEVGFYFLIPPFTFVGSYLHKRLGVFSVSVYLIALWAIFIPEVGALTLLAPIVQINSIFSVFVLGMALAFIMNATNIRPNWWMCTLIPVVAIVVFALMSPGARHLLFERELKISIQKHYLVLSFVTSLFVWALLDANGLFGRILRSKPLQMCGEWSFSIYLFHWMVVSKLASANQGNWFVLILAILEAIALGGLLYYLLEAPLEKFRHRLMKAIISKREVISPVPAE